MKDAKTFIHSLNRYEERMLIYMFIRGFVGKNSILAEKLEEMMEKEGIFEMTDEEFKFWTVSNRSM